MGMILIFEIFFVCLNGGIYDYTFALYGVIFFTGIAVMAKRRNMVRIPRNITSYGLGVILLGHIDWMYQDSHADGVLDIME